MKVKSESETTTLILILTYSMLTVFQLFPIYLEVICYEEIFSL